MNHNITDVQKEKLLILNEYLEGHNGFICGGCFKDIFLNKSFRDVDMYFINQVDFSQADNLFYSRVKDGTYKLLYSFSTVKAYQNIATSIVVELISVFFGTPLEIINKFDFTVCKFAYYKSDEEYKTEYHFNYFYHLSSRLIEIDGMIYNPTKTFLRIYKYIKYGFNPTFSTIKSILKRVNDIDEEQLDLSLMY